MNRVCQMLGLGVTLLGTAAATVMACGTPPTPPPPPPDPPIVCCQVIDWFVSPDGIGECLIVRYFRKDGLPLYQSNPMPLPATQQCLCAVPPLPLAAQAAGVVVEGLSFGSRPECWDLPPNVPGFGPFEPEPDPNTQFQIDNFFDIYFQIAVDPDLVPPAPGEAFSRAWTFSGPGNIPSGQVFDIYQKIRIPSGYDPNQLCVPGQNGLIGLFLVDNGQVFIEPAQPGPPVSLTAFSVNPGNSAFYKFRWYPVTVPGPCVCPTGPVCPGDVNGDGAVNLVDLNLVLFNFGLICP